MSVTEALIWPALVFSIYALFLSIQNRRVLRDMRPPEVKETPPQSTGPDMPSSTPGPEDDPIRMEKEKEIEEWVSRVAGPLRHSVPVPRLIWFPPEDVPEANTAYLRQAGFYFRLDSWVSFKGNIRISRQVSKESSLSELQALVEQMKRSSAEET